MQKPARSKGVIPHPYSVRVSAQYVIFNLNWYNFYSAIFIFQIKKR